MKKLFTLAAALAVVYVLMGRGTAPAPPDGTPAPVHGVDSAVPAEHDRAAAPAQSTDGASVDDAYASHRSHVQVTGSGVIARLLPEDDNGSRHQRFIIRLPSGLTLLVAHNIDLAARVPGLNKGDEISFSGEYEWNERGGVLHWTHHDPRSVHPGGWLEHDGQRYQ